MAEEKGNVFISWSGPRSKHVAQALRDWLPMVVQAAKPWMSSTDIDKGTRSLEEISTALEGMKVGIICLTPENLSAKWILFEAGGLLKTEDAKSRVCTYLLAGLEPQSVEQPLGMFQATKAEKEDTRHLVHTINKALGSTVTEATLNGVFDALWPELEKKLSALPAPGTAIPPKRPVDDMVAEILELSRSMVDVRDAVVRLEGRANRQAQAEAWARLGTFGTGGKSTGFLSDMRDIRAFTELTEPLPPVRKPPDEPEKK